MPCLSLLSRWRANAVRVVIARPLVALASRLLEDKSYLDAGGPRARSAAGVGDAL